ncbi:hypothetical protein IEQ34_000632 [Dendrobium chrysotoxum]|uniref:Uncharacterized protein n=1 Tax=Dendrobium chrysotoxum TaxID=161865 RepID=A0AAV7HAT2_DENCH|nr:hypothetical protein IEQ34_000632 [Dendrobium chrysotoxum]
MFRMPSLESLWAPVGSTAELFRMAVEEPFGSRERIRKLQQYFQSIDKPVYLKGRYDIITSVAIPLALATTTIALTARGIYNMAHGIGKKE